MTELGELINVAVALDAKTKNKCPFCGEAPHGFGKNKEKKPSEVVKSIPSSLGCKSLSGGDVKGDCRYTTAAHHLICAIQCYAQVKTLVRMGSLVGYNINSEPNGMPLPTVRNKYRGKNFGKLSDEKDAKGLSVQDDIAFGVMAKTRAQWHVGHHSFEVTIVDYDETEGGDDNEYLHTTSYDCEVIKMLLDITVLFQQCDLCKDEDGNDDAFKQTMNEISSEIASHLRKFDSKSPLDSKPFFVSDRAKRYADAVADRTWPREAT